MRPRAIRAVAVGLLLTALTAVTMTGLILGRPLPTIDGHYRMLGLHGRAEVLRDAFGVPRIEAGDTHDLFFLQGYVTAQDRFAQMDAMRAEAHARVEPPGTGAGGELQVALDAYAAGVTKFIEQHAAARALPAEIALSGKRPDPWRPIDSLAIAVAYLERNERSACVAVSGERTHLGSPILAAELRTDAPAPGWYEIGLRDGLLRVVGISLPGVPGVVAGHNGRLAWSIQGLPDRPSQATWTVGAILEASFVSSAAALIDTFAENVPFTGCAADDRGTVTTLEDVGARPEGPAITAGDVSLVERAVDVIGEARDLDVEAMRVALGAAARSDAGARIVIDLGDLDASRSALSTGQSAHRAARHYRDQAQIWSAGQLHRLAWTRQAVARTEGQLVLRPR
jgi:acyl-homoserine lactone acylase PvdQ